ncbi:MAG: ParB/RepB/Spo0J family partition protein [Patescibacteria group bacterium]
MSPLGRGLASLIPNRGDEDVEETLERIDSLEVVEDPTPPAPPAGLRGAGAGKQTKKVRATIDEFGDDDDSGMQRPSKPNVTPLDPNIFLPGEGPIVDTVHRRTMLTVEQLPDNAPDPFDLAQGKERLKITQQEEVSVEASVPEAIEEELEEEKEEEFQEPVSKPASVGTSAGKWDIHEDKVIQIPIGDIQINPLQPRRQFDPAEMEELVQSIDEHGILQPLVVRRVAKDAYELIAGERRLRAAKQLGWERVPCVVKVEVAGTEKSLVYALIENLQREDLNPMEEALAYERLNKEFGMTHEEIGQAMGSSRVRVTNAMRVLQLPVEIQRGLSEGKITSGHAKAILMIPDPEKQIRFYNHLVEEGLTVRKAEVRARRIQRAMKVDDPMRHKNRRGRHPFSVKYRPYLEERFGFNSDVKYNEQKNRYEVVFRAYSDGEVQQLLDRLLGRAPLPKNVDDDIVGEENEDLEDDGE